MNKKQINSILTVLCFVPLMVALYTCYRVNAFGGLEDGHKLVIYFVLILLAVLVGFLGIYLLHSKLKKKIKTSITVVAVILSAIFVGANIYASSLLTKVHDTLTKISTQEETHIGGIVVLNDSKYKSVSELKEKKIGHFELESSMENYVIPMSILADAGIDKDVTYVSFDDMSSLIDALYTGKVDAIMASSSYISTFENLEGYADVALKTTMIESKEETKLVEIDNKGDITALQEPFAVLFMGVDTNKPSKNGSLVGNADALFLATVNPKNYTINITSIPRDSYVPIACYGDKRRDKITHSNVGGTECVVNTVANLFDIKIDYYIKINFKGLEDLVDALGGVYVEVDAEKYPNGVVGQNGKRHYESGYKWIWVPPGKNKVSGEQALAYARIRKTLENGATERAANQTIVIDGIIKEFLSLDTAGKIFDVLDVAGKNIQTNFTADQMTSFYTLGIEILNRSHNLNVNDSVIIDYYLVSGYDRKIYHDGEEKLLYYYVPFEGSIKDIKKKIHQNLGLEPYDKVGSFDYDSKVAYTKDNAVFYYYDEKQEVFQVPDLVPDMYGMDVNDAIAWAQARGIGYTINEILPGNELYNESLGNGFVIGHNEKINRRSSKVSNIVINVIKTNTVVATPEIKLSKTQDSIIVGDPLPNLPEAKAYNAKGQDVSANIQVAGNRDNTVAGTYVVVFSVVIDGQTYTANYTLTVNPKATQPSSSSSSTTSETTSQDTTTTTQPTNPSTEQPNPGDQQPNPSPGDGGSAGGNAEGEVKPNVNAQPQANNDTVTP
ncbi:MAG: LCP family protein [Erysipelotrichaceae bacterium]|nr:LCP family protein [Erysipelotrichaceae bacterium]